MKYKNVTEKKFYENKENHLGVTDFVHFGRAVVATRLSRRTIQMRLSQLLNRRDYPGFTLKEMLDHYEWLANLKYA